MLRGRDVLVRGGQVVSVAEAGSASAPPDAATVQGRGLTLLPGLVDSHIHLTSLGGPPWVMRRPDMEASARALLNAGVTTALVAHSAEAEASLDRKGRAGELLAPHFYLSGPGLSAPGGHPIPLMKALIPWPISWFYVRGQPTASTAEEARAAVDRTAVRFHPPFFKLFYDSIPPGSPHLSLEVLRAAVEEAKARGMRPVVHVGSSRDMVEAAEAGVALLMHTAYEDRLSDEQVARLKALGIPFVTTSRVVVAAHDLEQGRASDFERRTVDPEVFDAFRRRPKGWHLKGMESVEAGAPTYAGFVRDNIQRLAAAGLVFFVGTDTGVPGLFPGAALHGELAALASLGLPPLELLKACTSRPAAFLDPSGSFGRVAAGQRADLLLVRGDPSADIAALDNIEALYLEGVRLERSGP